MANLQVLGLDLPVRMLSFCGPFVLLLCSSSLGARGYAFAPSMIVSKSAAGDAVTRQKGLTGGPTEYRTTATPSSAYVNLPFCRRRCFYCDFPIKVEGSVIAFPFNFQYVLYTREVQR